MIRTVLSFIAGGVLVALFFIARQFTAEVPPSEHVSEAATRAVEEINATMAMHALTFISGDIDEQRSILNEKFYAPKIKLARELYPVDEEVWEIDGVYTEVFTPANGISPENKNRVLINLHGGAFSLGARTGGRLESIPVASVMGIKIVSVDYRQGPEHRFPAGSEDVATVYQRLLQDYAPENIGIFGCSAGGMLTAQSIAWFDKHDLPMPGAIGIFCAGAGEFGTGDAKPISKALGTWREVGELVYFRDADWNDPLIAPMNHPQLLAKFPPSLIITSTRDAAMSAALVTHQRLVEQAVESQLHVYEGLVHFYFADTETPESKHTFNVIARFFDRKLAQ